GWRNATRPSSCRATPICSAPSRSPSGIIFSGSWKRSTGTMRASSMAPGARMFCRSGPGPSPDRPLCSIVSRSRANWDFPRSAKTVSMPWAYQRDLQEDNRPLFDSVTTVKDALQVFATMLPELTINTGRMESAADDPNLLATDLAEYLVKKGMPFREAHEAVGKLVAGAVTRKMALNNMSLSEIQKISRLFEDDVLKIFDVRASLAKRTATGAPSPENVAAQIA